MSSFFAGGGGTLRGACLLCRPLTPPLACFFAPIPPTPFPSGEGGRLKVILCKGLRPLHPRGLNPCGTCSPCRCGARRGACPQRCRFGGRWRHPAGGLPSLSPAYPAFSLPFRPHPPARARRALFPAGRGRLKVILCKGLRPLHPRGLNPCGTCLPSRCGARRGACPGVAGSAGVGAPCGGLAFFVARQPCL